MAVTQTTNYALLKPDKYEINWDDEVNGNMDSIDSLINKLEMGPRGVNFIPHALFQWDSNADGVPELWEVYTGGAYVDTTVLSASELFAFAQKLVVTISNSSGSTQYVGIRLPSVIPPNTDITFSAWLKSIDLNVKTRIYDGTSNFDSTYAKPATATRDSVSQVLGVTISSVELIVLIEVPDLTVSKTVEIQLPQLNIGDVATGFIPSPGEMNQLIVNDLYVMGLLKANLDCNQKQLKQLRLELRTSDPGSPVRGQIWFDDSTGKKRPRFYDNTAHEHLSVAKQTHVWVVGSLSVATEQGGVWLAPRSLTIEKAYIYCKTTGSASSTIVDINKNSTTIFTTQANRPTLAYDDGDKKAESGTPDVTSLAEGDIVSIDIDQIATGVADLSVILICR